MIKGFLKGYKNNSGCGSLAGMTSRKPKQYAPMTRPSKHSDELVKEIIRAKRVGATYKSLTEKYGISINVIRAWCQGTNRRLCLDAVLKEKV